MRKVFVFGATGQQGSGVVDGLLSIASDFHIVTMSRNASAQKAVDLRSNGVEVIEGDFENQDTLRTILRGIESVFLNLDYW
jgi:uncharacterized protein YbjT (DUF2867 family)